MNQNYIKEFENAVKKENIKQIKYYLDKFKQMNINIYRRSYFIFCISDLQSIKILKFLISYGIDFNRMKNSYYIKPIYKSYNLKMIRCLARFDKNIFYNIKQNFNYLDILLSEYEPDIRIIKYLLSIGLQKNKNKYINSQLIQNRSRIEPPYILIIHLNDTELNEFKKFNKYKTNIYRYNIIRLKCITNKNKYIISYI